MAGLIEGRWVATLPAAEEIEGGRFVRLDSAFRDAVSPDPGAAFPAAAGRYHLWVAYSCPWASRTLAVRALKGLEDVISISVASPGLGSEGWTYAEGPVSPVEGGFPLHRLYAEAVPNYTGKVTVPTLWDRQSRRIVNNESSEIIRILNSAFDGITGNQLDLYPESLRAEIDRWNALIYPAVNNGVYRAGFATSQAAYDEAVRELFAMLDTLDAHLARHRYLAGGLLHRGRLAAVRHARPLRHRLSWCVQVQPAPHRRLSRARSLSPRIVSMARHRRDGEARSDQGGLLQPRQRQPLAGRADRPACRSHRSP